MKIFQLLSALVALVLISCSLRSDSAGPIGGQVGGREVVVYCPDDSGLCRWHDNRWSPFWTASSPDRVRNFQQLGRTTIIFDQGHGEAGRILVDHENGMIVLRHELNEAGGCDLDKCAGWDSSGRIVLCDGNATEYQCDIWLDPKALGDDRSYPDFPENCLFPRFLSDGSLACLGVGPRVSILLEVRAGLGRFNEYSLELENKWVESFEIENRKFALVASDDTLYMWNGTTVEHLAGPGVRNLTQVGSRYFWARCRASETIMFSECRVETLTAANKIRTVWGPRDAFPEKIVETSDGYVAIDSWGQFERQLWLLDIHPEGVKEELIFAYSFSDKERDYK